MVLRSPEDELIGCPNCVMYCAAKPMVPADNTLNIIKYLSSKFFKCANRDTSAAKN